MRLNTVDGLVWLSLAASNKSNVKLYQQTETLWFPPPPNQGLVVASIRANQQEAGN